MKVVFEILITAAPLLSATIGALISEFTGMMAVFIDGIINLSAFLFYAVTVLTGNFFLGLIAAFIAPLLLVFAAALFMEYFKANPFLMALAINLVSTGMISLCSSALFGTNGVLSNRIFFFPAAIVRPVTSIVVWTIAIVFSALSFHSTWGIRTRITGSNPDLLIARGFSPRRYRILSWCAASCFASISGCTLAMRLSSFVPNISSGRGWIALAAVFLVRRNGIGVIFAVLAFAVAEYFSNILPGIGIFSGIPSAFTLSFPYAAAFLLLIVIPHAKE